MEWGRTNTQKSFLLAIEVLPHLLQRYICKNRQQKAKTRPSIDVLVSGSAKGSGLSTGLFFHASSIETQLWICAGLKVDEKPLKSSCCIREKWTASSKRLVSVGPVVIPLLIHEWLKRGEGEVTNQCVYKFSSSRTTIGRQGCLDGYQGPSRGY